jgi:hypothetical protein
MFSPEKHRSINVWQKYLFIDDKTKIFIKRYRVIIDKKHALFSLSKHIECGEYDLT